MQEPQGPHPRLVLRIGLGSCRPGPAPQQNQPTAIPARESAGGAAEAEGEGGAAAAAGEQPAAPEAGGAGADAETEYEL